VKLTPPPRVAIGRLKASGVAHPGIPGAQWQSNSTQAIVANQVRYNGFITDTPIAIDALVAEISATGTATLLRMGIYAADTDWQPVGAPVVDGGTVSAAAAVAVSITVNATLAPGRYITALNAAIEAARARHEGRPLAETWRRRAPERSCDGGRSGMDAELVEDVFEVAADGAR